MDSQYRAFDSAPVFFHDSLSAEDSEVEITGEEASHILRSRRLQVGDEIILTDGKGLQATATIQRVNQKQHSLAADIGHSKKLTRHSVKRILATAIPKGDRQSVLLNMATQLGMNEYWPLDCDRSVVKYQKKMQERWQRLIVGACKQSGQCYFPTIGSEKRLEDLIFTGSALRLIVVGDIHGQSIEMIRKRVTSELREVLMLIGPEGGFSSREIELLEQQTILKLRLSNQILRIETAAISLLAAVNQLI